MTGPDCWKYNIRNFVKTVVRFQVEKEWHLQNWHPGVVNDEKQVHALLLVFSVLLCIFIFVFYYVYVIFYFQLFCYFCCHSDVELLCNGRHKSCS